jgi:magnesium-transporting ATPase (P-type)
VKVAEQVEWHSLSAAEVQSRLGATVSSGLASREAASRLTSFGPNALPERQATSLATLFFHQFKSPLIYLLLGASVLAFALGERGDALVILAVVFLNSVIGTIHEGRAERSLESLKRLARQQVRVRRGGREALIEARELVPGDLLLLSAGDAVGADARVLASFDLQVAEAALTGESLPVGKQVEPVALDTLLADRRSMVYSGTHVTAGRAEALVVATGQSTEVGRIARLTSESLEPKTPLEQKVVRFGRAIMIAAALIFVLVIGLGLLPGDWLLSRS